MFDVKELTKEVDEELKEESLEEAKTELKSKKREIQRAKKIVRQLELEEQDIISRIAQGV